MWHLFFCPLNHPSLQSESKLFGSVVGGLIGDHVSDQIEEFLDTKTAEAQASITKCVSEAIEAQLGKIGAEIKTLEATKKEIAAQIDESDHGHLSTPTQENSRENLTNHIEDYVEDFLTDEEARKVLIFCQGSGSPNSGVERLLALERGTPILGLPQRTPRKFLPTYRL